MSETGVLRARLGDRLEPTRFALDGISVESMVRPENAAALGETLGALHETDGAALVRGGGSRMGWGNPLTRADVVISTERMVGVEELDLEEGVVCVRAGTRLAALRETLGEEGWTLPLDPPGSDSTVGGALASAAFGPRAEIYGLPRDRVLGLDVVLASGEQTRCGGRVVKNVTGYDLSKLYVGSLGTVGVIAGAWLRLFPKPECEAVCVMDFAGIRDAAHCALALSRRPGDHAVAQLAGAAAATVAEDADSVVAVLSSGDEDWVSSEQAFLRAEFGARDATLEDFDRVREIQGGETAAECLRVLLLLQPTSLPASLERLLPASRRLVSYPARGVISVAFETDPSGIDALFEEVAAVTAAGHGSYFWESVPPAVKNQRNVFGAASETEALSRAIKQRFDPKGVLSPGRSAGCL